MYRLVVAGFVVFALLQISLAQTFQCKTDDDGTVSTAQSSDADTNTASAGAIIDAHNDYRNQIALGKVSGYPAACGMPPLVWNQSLAVEAMAWAQNCVFQHGCSGTTDACPVAKNANEQYGFGQNIGMMMADYDLSTTNPPDYKGVAIDGWFNEYPNYPPKGKWFIEGATVQNFKQWDSAMSEELAWGHFTQVVWGTTTSVGCGYAYYYNEPKKLYNIMVVCNYYPAGNYADVPIYPTCDANSCPDGTQPDKKYTGLCVPA